MQRINFLNEFQAMGINDPKKDAFRIVFAKVVSDISLGLLQSNMPKLAYFKNNFFCYSKNHWQAQKIDDVKKLINIEMNMAGVPQILANDFKFIDDVVKQLQINCYIKLEDPENVTYRINLKNGTMTFDPITKETLFTEHNFKDYLTYVLPYDYDPKQKCPRFDKYISEVLDGDFYKKILLEFLGWCFMPTSTMRLEKCLVLLGDGSNGKSVFFDIARALIGNENITFFSPKELMEEHNRAEIQTKLLNYSGEFEQGIDTNVFKTLVSGDPVMVRQKYGHPHKITDYAKIAFNTNQLPRNTESTNAFYRRFLIVPFEKRIEDSKKEVDLAQKIIRDELPGIFNEVLSGYMRIIEQRGFSRYMGSKETVVDKYKRESDSVLMFFYDNEKYGKSIKAIELVELYGVYQTYCKEAGFKYLNRNNFLLRIEKYGAKRIDGGLSEYPFLDISALQKDDNDFLVNLD